MAKETKDTGKVGDLAASLQSIQEAIDELAQFMSAKVKPLLKNRTNSEIEVALKTVVTPRSARGLKHVLNYIDDRVKFVRKESGKKPRGK
ncbi:MAG: hypothetical protein ABJC89_18095 [Acidobacteriota bacterium]